MATEKSPILITCEEDSLVLRELDSNINYKSNILKEKISDRVCTDLAVYWIYRFYEMRWDTLTGKHHDIHNLHLNDVACSFYYYYFQESLSIACDLCL